MREQAANDPLLDVDRDAAGHERAEEAQLRRARYAVLRADVSAALAERNTLRSSLQQCAVAIVRHFDASFARIWILDTAENVLQLEASAGIYTHLDGAHSRIPVGQFKIGRIARQRQPYLTNDVLNDPHIDRTWAQQQGLVSFAGYPLIVDDRLVGVMALFARQPLAADTLDAFASVADVIAQAIERRRAEEALQRANDELERRVQQRTAELARANERLRFELVQRERVERRLAAQYAISRVLSEAASFDDAAPHMLRIIGESLQWEIGQFWYVDRQASVLRWSASWHGSSTNAVEFEAVSRQMTFARGVGLLGTVWAGGEPRWLGDIRAATNFPRLIFAAQLGLRSAFAFPIHTSSGLFGVMEFFSRETRPPDDALLQMVAVIGHQGGQFIERRRAETAVRASEARKTAILDAALDCVITMDHDGRVVEWNRAAEATFGYRSAEALGREMAELIIPPSLRERHRRGLAHYLATGEGPIIGQRIELQAIRAGGAEFPVELTVTRIPWDGPPMFTGFVRDITARKRAEEAIRFQAQLLDTVEQAVIATDAGGIIIYWNRFAETLYGWSAPEALGRYVVDLTAAPTSHAEAEQILDRLRAGQSWSGEFIVQRRDGTTFPALVTDAPVYDDAGNVIAIVGVSLDITERKQAEETAHFLAAASAVLASSLDDATILENLARLAVPRVADWCVVDMVAAGGTFRRSAVAHVDPAKVELLDALERRYPTDPNAPHGYPLVIRTGQPELIPEIPGALLAAVATDAAHLEMLRALGLRSNLCVPLTARGRTIGALTLATAESRRIYGPADLALAEDLAHRAALAIDNARLYQEAQTAIRLRDEFLSVAAHELKTPVTGLLGYAQLLERRAAREPATNERVRHAVRVIGAQAERLSRLVESLLDVSRLETGSFVLDRQPVDLCALVREVGQETQPALHRHTLECICDAGPVAVEADRLRLEQVIQNLLQNAIKYSPEGGPIMLRVERHADHAALIVSDQGVGIPQEARPHLFERFYRASNIAGSNISGIGIGLYLANEIVTRHGGTIEVTSTEGAGSTFTVRLPLAPVPTGAG